MSTCRKAAMAVGLLLLLAATTARAQDREVAFGLSYSSLDFNGGAADELDGDGGPRFDVRYSWQPLPPRPEVRFAPNLGFSAYRQEGDSLDDEDEDDDFFFSTDDFIELGLIAPEFQVSWRQPISERFFVEPGLAVGLVAGNFRTGEAFFFGEDEDESGWRANIMGGAFVRLAYAQRRWSAGVEIGYRISNLDFGDDIGGNLEQFHAGAFFGWAF